MRVVGAGNFEQSVIPNTIGHNNVVLPLNGESLPNGKYIIVNLGYCAFYVVC